MGFFYSTELSVPLIQIAFLLALSTLVLLFGRVKLALLTNYIFVLYWGYGFNGERLIASGGGEIGSFTIFYFGFGLIIAILAAIGFFAHSQ